MAIQKRFIHFKKFSDFNSRKLSANEANTQYTVGVGGEIQNGSPDVLYQSIVWIKDTKQQWTHGQLYSGEDFGERPFVNEAEFSFRATAGKQNSVKDGLATIESIYGNSIVWNQKVDPSDVSANNSTISKNGNSVTATLNATSVSKGYGGIGFNMKDSLIADHYYYIHIDDVSYATSISNLTIGDMVKGDILTASGVLTKAFVIKASGSSSPQSIYINAVGNLVSGATFTIIGLKCVDLTRMYSAGNEPTTVEDFHSRMPIVADMNSYNEGEILHMNVDAIKSVGDNAWDEQWEVGQINTSTGEAAFSDRRIRSKFIKVLEGEKYFYNTEVGTEIFFYDHSKNFIKYLGNDWTKEITIPQGCGYIKFCTYSVYGPSYKNDIIFSLVHSGWKQDTNAEYQPYWQDVQSLEVLRKYFPDGMRSVGATYDEVRFNSASGKWEAVQRVGEVNLGNLTWTAETFNGNQAFRSRGNNLNAQYKDTTDYYICARYESVGKDIYTSGKIGVAMNNGYYDSESAKDFIVVRDTAYSSANAFKSAMAGVMLYYELAQPIVTEIAKDINLDYRVADFGTEEAISSQSSTPFKAKIKYNFNANDTIRTNALAISNLTESKQDKLVSGTNIKTINGESILGSGNITIGGGSGEFVLLSSSETNITLEKSKCYFLRVEELEAYNFTLPLTLGATTRLVISASKYGPISFNGGEVVWSNGNSPIFEDNHFVEILFISLPMGAGVIGNFGVWTSYAANYL